MAPLVANEMLLTVITGLSFFLISSAIEHQYSCGHNVAMKESLVRARIDEELKDRAIRIRQRAAGRRRESRLANELDLDLLNEQRALSPAERLDMFLRHSRHMAQLQDAGKALRSRRT